MPLISLQNVSIRFRDAELLDEVSCQIEPGDRIGLLGRNGAGKSTLLKILAGQIEPDHGSVVVAPATRVAYLQQDVPAGAGQTVAQLVAAGLDQSFREVDQAWRGEQLVRQTLENMNLDAEARFLDLSSGMKRRTLLARAVVGQPDLLLLDEPTNHLDIDAIRWLEQYLAGWPGTFVVVTHDRMFLSRVATRILELDRGWLFDGLCDYETYLKRKEQALAAEEKQNALFDKKLAQEEAWIRQGIKARRTRNEGRVRALKQMREQRRNRRDRQGRVRLEIQTGQRSGALVAELKEVSFAYHDQPILENFSTTVMRGDKIGVIGPNGAGKTTFLKILLGALPPDSGTVRTGTNLEVAYFDQLRDQLREEQTIEENVGEGKSEIELGGRRRHIVGYLQEFLFTPDRIRTPVKFLSGGERNRVLLAKLFTRPANVIVLDEPTNDLDAETLEMLEAKLVDYEGTILLVSHDRAFLNNVVTSLVAFEPGGVREVVGGYDDWLAQQPDAVASTPEKQPTTARKPRPSKSTKKLSYNEQRELASLPEQIEQFETEIAAFHEEMADPQFYQQSSSQIAAAQTKLQTLETSLAEAYARWEELEAAQAAAR